MQIEMLEECVKRYDRVLRLMNNAGKLSRKQMQAAMEIQPSIAGKYWGAEAISLLGMLERSASPFQPEWGNATVYLQLIIRTIITASQNEP